MALSPSKKNLIRERGGHALIGRARALFGSWDAAVRSAGIQTFVSPWPKANRADIVAEIRRRKRAGKTLLFKKIQGEKWGRAFSDWTTKLFGSWNSALIAAGIEPVRQNSLWPKADKNAILREIRRRHRAGQSINTRIVQSEKWGQAFNVRARGLFGSWTAAILAAGLNHRKVYMLPGRRRTDRLYSAKFAGASGPAHPCVPKKLPENNGDRHWCDAPKSCSVPGKRRFLPPGPDALLTAPPIRDGQLRASVIVVSGSGRARPLAATHF